jgi:FKBP-type peptidyl-prolyl cis-trans isomerase FkpA
MIKRILTLAVLGAAFISNTGCNSGGGFKKINGVEYKIVKDAPGQVAKIGDVIEFHILAKVDTMVLGDSRKQPGGAPAARKVDSVKNLGQFEAVFPFLSAGDSVLIYVSCDTILKTLTDQQKQQLPPWLKAGKKITVTVAVVSVKSMDEYNKEAQAKQEQMMKEMQEKEAAQKPLDDQMLQDYLTKNNIKATKTASGLYYVVSKEGTGETAKAGQDVTMKYIGKTLEGKQFDANMDENYQLLAGKTPFSFQLGQGQVIKGWDEGLQLLKKGSKATIYIPSGLAYGSQAMGPDLPANSILVFTVEMMDVKAHTEPKAPEAPPAQ